MTELDYNKIKEEMNYLEDRKAKIIFSADANVKDINAKLKELDILLVKSIREEQGK